MQHAGAPVLIRVDGAAQVGLGHLQRSLSLATGLSSLGVPCLFVTNDDPLVSRRVSRFGFGGATIGAVPSWGEQDLGRTVQVAREAGCAGVVVDSDGEGLAFLAGLRREGFWVAAVDDSASYDFPCHLVVNGDAHAAGLQYTSSSGDTRFLLGPKYSILRWEFCKPHARIVRKTPEELLVMMGGADPFNLMPRVLALVKEHPLPVRVTGVVGPFFRDVEQMQAAETQAQGAIRLVFDPDSMRDLMLEADVAVSAGGQTLYELACVGTPTVAVSVADNQDRQLEAFSDSGCVIVAGRGDAPNIMTDIRNLVVSLFQEEQRRARMSAAGQQLIDGNGALRVASAILEMLTREHTGFRASRTM